MREIEGRDIDAVCTLNNGADGPLTGVKFFIFYHLLVACKRAEKKQKLWYMYSRKKAVMETFYEFDKTWSDESLLVYIEDFSCLGTIEIHIDTKFDNEMLVSFSHHCRSNVHQSEQSRGVERRSRIVNPY